MMRHFFKLTALSSALLCGSALASMPSPQADPVLFQARLTMTAADATHKLLPADMAMHAPHPFYTKFCSNKPAHAYPNAEGMMVLQFYPKINRVRYAIAFQGISGQVIMAHFHLGAQGVGGPIIQTICGNPPPGSKALGYSAGPAASGRYCPKGRYGFMVGSFIIKANKKVPGASSVEKFREALMHNQLYVNLHTCLNEVGELRGQVVQVMTHGA